MSALVLLHRRRALNLCYLSANYFRLTCHSSSSDSRFFESKHFFFSIFTSSHVDLDGNGFPRRSSLPKRSLHSDVTRVLFPSIPLLWFMKWNSGVLKYGQKFRAFTPCGHKYMDTITTHRSLLWEDFPPDLGSFSLQGIAPIQPQERQWGPELMLGEKVWPGQVPPAAKRHRKQRCSHYGMNLSLNFLYRLSASLLPETTPAFISQKVEFFFFLLGAQTRNQWDCPHTFGRILHVEADKMSKVKITVE